MGRIKLILFFLVHQVKFKCFSRRFGILKANGMNTPIFLAYSARQSALKILPSAKSVLKY